MVEGKSREPDGSLPKPIPERIREAREARGYSSEDFADLLGKSRQAVAQFETGQTTPTGETMSRIVAVTGQPPGFFSITPSRSGEVTSVFWRSLKRMEQKDRSRIARRLRWGADIIGLVDKFVDLPEPNLPEIEFNPEIFDEDAIEAAAEKLRDHWNLGRGPIENLDLIAEENGIILIREATDCADMDGLSSWIEGRPYVYLSSDVLSGPRDLFNFAHEIGHLCLHSAVELSSKNLALIEKQANRFASAFLLPRETFAREFYGTSLDFLLALKRRWGVAVAAIAYRAKDLQILTENQFSYVFRQLNARKIRKVEPFDDAFAVAKPQVLPSALSMLLENRVLSSNEIQSELGFNLEDVERLCSLESGYLNQKVVQLNFRKPNQAIES